MRKSLLMLSFLFAACNQEEIKPGILGQWEDQTEMVTPTSKSIKRSIVGRWEWQETSYNSRGTIPYTLTPSSTDTTMIVDIKPKTLKIYKNGIYFGEYSYTTNTVVGDQNIITIDYKDTPLSMRMEQGPIYFENNKLRIAGGYNDAGGDQVFIRKRTNKKGN